MKIELGTINSRGYVETYCYNDISELLDAVSRKRKAPDGDEAIRYIKIDGRKVHQSFADFNEVLDYIRKI